MSTRTLQTTCKMLTSLVWSLTIQYIVDKTNSMILGWKRHYNQQAICCNSFKTFIKGCKQFYINKAYTQGPHDSSSYSKYYYMKYFSIFFFTVPFRRRRSLTLVFFLLISGYLNSVTKINEIFKSEVNFRYCFHFQLYGTMRPNTGEKTFITLRITR